MYVGMCILVVAIVCVSTEATHKVSLEPLT